MSTEIAMHFKGNLKTVERIIDEYVDGIDRIEAKRAIGELGDVVRAEPNRDRLLGGVVASPDLPLSKATIDEMGVEIATRDWGQPAALVYQDRPGVWAVRLSVSMDAASFWKASNILLTNAYLTPEMAQRIDREGTWKRGSVLSQTAALFAANRKRQLWLRERSRWRTAAVLVAFVAGALAGAVSIAVALS